MIIKTNQWLNDQSFISLEYLFSFGELPFSFLFLTRGNLRTVVDSVYIYLLNV